MAGLLAWAADVVGGGGQSNEEDDSKNVISPEVFSPEQQQYVRQLDRKWASLSRSIQVLRLRLPPPDISQRLPHLHAHSLASNAAFALQLNSHSATREQEMDLTEINLKAELENVLAALDARQSGKSGELLIDSKTEVVAQEDTQASQSALLYKLENKQKELCSLEEMVQDSEKKWAQVQENALKQPSPAQREKILDRQLHSLIEQLAAKQDQAERLVSEIHPKEMELEKLNGMWRRLETSTVEMNTSRNRFGRSNSEKGSLSSDYMVDPHHRSSYHMGGRTENQQRLMLLRSAFVLYILALHILVFIKISF